MQNNGEDTILNIELKGDKTKNPKIDLNSYRTCAMTIFIHGHLDVFPQLLNIFHFMECTVTPQTEGHTKVPAHH